MLQLYIYGKKRQGFLDLPQGSSLDMEMFTELFDEELTLGAYSLPGEAGWTDNNKRLLDFAEMLNSPAGSEQNYWRCDVINDGVPEMLDAKFTLLGFDGSFSYDTGKYSYTISGNKGIFGTLIGKKTLRDLSLGKIIFPEGDTSRNFASLVMKGDPYYRQYPYLRFAPVAILNFFDAGRQDYNDEFIAEDIINNMVITGSGPDDWVFGRPLSTNNSIAVEPGSVEYLDYRTIPFFTYKWIIQKIFEEVGYTVQGEWINDTAWDDAVMFNNLAIEKYDTILFSDINTEIDIAKHLPKKSIATFLRDLQFLFNVKLSFLNGRVVSIDYRKNSLKNKQVMDATKLTGRLFNGTPADYKEKGFTLAYNFDTNDSYNSGRVQEIDPKKLVATIDKYADFATLIIGRPFEYNDLVYVSAENQYYAYTNGVGINAWDYFSEKLFPFSTGGDGAEGQEYEYKTGISPMVTYILYNDGTGKLENKDMAAADMKGSYFNKRFAVVENDFDTRIFFIKMISKNGITVPSSFVASRDINNQKRVPKSLAWAGEDGLYEYCWKDWFNFLINTRKVRTSLNLDQKTYNELKASNKINIAGSCYLPSTIFPKIPLREPVEVELYRM